MLGVGITYGLVRVILTYNFDLYTPFGETTGVSLSLIPFQLQNRLIGIALTFEGLWLVFLLVIGKLIYQKKFILTFCLCSLMLMHIIVAYSVYDITRSLTYAFPLFIIAVILVARQYPENTTLLLLAVAVLCLLIPTYYVIYFPRPIPWSIQSLTEIKSVVKSLLVR